MAPVVELHINKGKTLEFTLLYGDSELEFKPIAGVLSYAPLILSVPGHGLKEDWPIQIKGVKQPRQLNSGDASLRGCNESVSHYIVRIVDQDTIRLANVDGSDWSAYSAGGIVSYYPPGDLTGCEVRAQVRRRITDPAPVVGFASPGLNAEIGRVEINTAASSITFLLDAEDAAGLDAQEAVWDAELITANGRTRPLVGVSPCYIGVEVTR